MAHSSEILIKKASGDVTLFSYQKLQKSLQGAGAPQALIETILKEVENQLYQGISSREIYRKAFSLLKGKPGAVAARYKLKNAIMELGPSGFPFENFVAEILKHQGHQVKVGQLVKGLCVQHEIDVIADKNQHHYLIECKFHNQPGYQCDVKVPLYINSRFKDVEAQLKKQPGHAEKFHQGWVVTNTRFSQDAITYGTCAGLKLIGWNYPEKGNLKDMVEASGVQPLTALTTLTSAEKQSLLSEKIVLCKDITQTPALLQKLGINPERIQKIKKEAEALCNHANY